MYAGERRLALNECRPDALLVKKTKTTTDFAGIILAT
jgi:hypothetical protein